MSCHECEAQRSPTVRLTWLGGLGVLLLTAMLLSPVLQFDFVSWDDDVHVYANPRMYPVTWTHIAAFWQAPYAGLYIPLTYTVWSALVWLTQALQPGPMIADLFHGLNLLLHLGSTVLVYRLALLLLGHRPGQLVEKHTLGAAVLGALFFGLHPLQMEPVAWVSGLKDVLYGWWVLMAVWHYLAYVRADRGRQRCGHYGIATVAFGLALLAKPTAVVAPVAAGLLATLGLGQSAKAAGRGLALWIALAVGWGIWTKEFQPNAVMEMVVPLKLRLIIAADALAFYLGKLVWPLHLGPDYGRTPQIVLSQVWGWLTGLVPIGAGMILWATRRQLPVLRLAAGLFVAGVLPVLGLVPFLFQEHSTVADRYTYLAILGPALLLACLLKQWKGSKVIWLAGGLVVALLGWRSASQVGVWRDTATLFTDALRVNPRSALAYNNLGLFLARQGRLDEAIAHYQQALQLKSGLAYTHNNLALALTNQDRLDEAVVHYTEALRLKPDYTNARNNLGLALIRQGRPNHAIIHFNKLLENMPEDAMTRNNLGIALAAQGNYTAAIQQFVRAIQLRPDFAKAYHNLGLAFQHQSRSSKERLHARP